MKTTKQLRLVPDQRIPREKWREARRLAVAHGGWLAAYRVLEADGTADQQVRRVVAFVVHGGGIGR